LKVVVEEDEKSCRNFLLSEIGHDFACTSTTSRPMDKWILQADSAHQIGLKPTLQGILIVVESGGRGGWKKLPEFFALRNWARFCSYLNNLWSHGQMDVTGRFGASNWSRNHLDGLSNCR
jgi:hypothetical protein